MSGLLGALEGAATSVSGSLTLQDQRDYAAQLEASKRQHDEYLMRLTNSLRDSSESVQHDRNRGETLSDDTRNRQRTLDDQATTFSNQKSMAGINHANAIALQGSGHANALDLQAKRQAAEDGGAGDMENYSNDLDELVNSGKISKEQAAIALQQKLSPKKEGLSDTVRLSTIKELAKERLQDLEDRPVATGKTISTPGKWYGTNETPEMKKISDADWALKNRPDLYELLYKGRVPPGDGLMGGDQPKPTTTVPNPGLDATSSKPATSPSKPNQSSGNPIYWTGEANGSGQAEVKKPFTPVDPATFGNRQDGTAKGNGYLGQMPMKDGRVMTEYSVGVTIDGKQMDIPTVVPTLTREEMQSMLDGNKPTRAIIEKATEFAKGRLAEKKSVYAEAGDQPLDGLNALESSRKSNVNISAGKDSPAFYQKGGLMSGSVDFGSAIGKPMAAAGTVAGKAIAGTVDGAVDLVKVLPKIKSAMTEVEYNKAMALAEAGNDTELFSMLKRLGIDAADAGLLPFTGGGSTATDDYMKNTKSDNLNQFYRKRL